MPRRDERYTYTLGIPAPRIGELLVRTRIEAGFDQRTLGKALSTSSRRLKRWESGEEVPSDFELEDFAGVCGVVISDIFPARDRVEYDPSSFLMRVGDALVAVSDADNENVLTTYLNLVRQQRALPDTSYVHIRRSDIDLLANALDLHDELLEVHLVRLVGLSPQTAAELRMHLIRRRHPSSGRRSM